MVLNASVKVLKVVEEGLILCMARMGQGICGIDGTTTS